MAVTFEDKVYRTFEEMRDFSRMYNVMCDGLIFGKNDGDNVIGTDAVFLPEYPKLKPTDCNYETTWILEPMSHMISNSVFGRFERSYGMRKKWFENDSKFLQSLGHLEKSLNGINFQGDFSLPIAAYLPNRIYHPEMKVKDGKSEKIYPSILETIKKDTSIISYVRTHPFVKSGPGFMIYSYKNDSLNLMNEPFSSGDKKRLSKIMGDRDYFLYTIIPMSNDLGIDNIFTRNFSK